MAGSYTTRDVAMSLVADINLFLKLYDGSLL